MNRVLLGSETGGVPNAILRLYVPPVNDHRQRGRDEFHDNERA